LRKPARTSVARDYAQPDVCSAKRPPGARRGLPELGAWDALWGLLAIAVLLGHGLTAIALEPSTSAGQLRPPNVGDGERLCRRTRCRPLLQTEMALCGWGTEVGLVRFDGNGFQVFDRNSTPALPGNDVRCLLETKDGALWIGTSEGLGAVEKTRRLRRSPHRMGCRETESGRWFEAANGGLWVLDRWRIGAAEWGAVLRRLRPRMDCQPGKITAVATGRSGRFVDRYNGGHGRIPGRPLDTTWTGGPCFPGMGSGLCAPCRRMIWASPKRALSSMGLAVASKSTLAAFW